MKGIDVVLPKQDIIRRLSSILTGTTVRMGKGYYNDNFCSGMDSGFIVGIIFSGTCREVLAKNSLKIDNLL